MNCLWAVAIRPGHRTCTTLLGFTWFNYKPSNKLVLCFLSPPQWWEGNTWRGQLTAVVSPAPAQPPVSRAKAPGSGTPQPLSGRSRRPVSPHARLPSARNGRHHTLWEPAGPAAPRAPHLRCPPPPSSALPGGAPARTTSPVVPGGGAAARRGGGAVAEAEPGPARRGRAGPLPPCPGTTWPP